MLSAAGRALLARAALAAPASGTSLAVASSAYLPLGRWQQRGGLTTSSSASASASAAAAETPAAASPPPKEDEQQQVESPPPPAAAGSGDQQGASASAAAAAPAATIPAAAATSSSPAGAQVGARLVQPVPRGGGGGGGGRAGAGGDRGGGGSSSRPPGRSLTGTVHVASTPNNTLMTLLSREGLVKTLVTGGSVGFRNSAKGTPQAAERAAAEIARRALGMGIGSVAVRFRGTGRNKQFALSALAAAGLNVTSLEDVTAVAYNGCRLPRRRRV